MFICSVSMNPPVLESSPPPGISCAGCGYNLRGLATEGRCPECGHDIADSIRVHGQFPWQGKALGRLRLGLLLMHIAPAVWAAAMAGFLFSAPMPERMIG